MNDLTPEQFRAAIGELSQQVATLQNGQAQSRQLHQETQARIDSIVTRVHTDLRSDLRVVHSRVDGIVGDVRAGLRDDLKILLEPMQLQQVSQGKKIDDHEARLRTVESKGYKRDAGIASLSAVIMAAAIEGIRFLAKAKGGP
jgi:hypothetical protein